ncbi:MAG: outer membrane protein assembly factor BamA [Deltaproteobacteria bacterium CG_4_10_14_0_2_um_filter_43_8]|nr:MAG: outer membrane protein assembly factor BamA [Deltaproteobacteria bacterium CG11_big_fil_rev_8_21_14_0_20_42_23]PJA18214.1 MAG: outer membrane protein assembly factor BamA [Deltaproteobacteria bacterium CG_4_10_14_0_2_um_filter_43_8]PJC65115.1 MAG: outer membrane protein assembly factor BamA [Deltaproteobacteria bacterium CG_4_9_14_0_2_um_filter_42_21]
MIKKFLTLLFLFVFLFCKPSLASNGIDTVCKITLNGLSTIKEETFLSVIPLEVGEKFSIQRIDQSLNALRKWGVFDTIAVHFEAEKFGINVVFNLKEATVVSLVEISGNFPYVQNKIRKYLTLQAGNIYTHGTVEKQKEIIINFYKRQGYINTEVEIQEEFEPEKNGIALIFHILRGEILRYKKIEVVGNTAFPKGRFVSLINPLKAYSESRLKQSIRNLNELYRMNGYPRAKVQVEEKDIDYEQNKINLLLSVEEGPQVKVSFRGNERVRYKTLRDTISIFQEGSFDGFEIEESEKRIKDLYAKLAYPNATITSSRKKINEQLYHIIFTIDEGTHQYIKDISFENANSISEDNLKAGMINTERSFGNPAPHLPQFEATDLNTVEENLKALGYTDAQVEAWKTNHPKMNFPISITIPVNPGDQITLGTISFEGNNSFKAKKLKTILKYLEEDVFYEPNLLREKQSLLIFYADNGYPYAEIKERFSIDPETQKAAVVYEIHEGKPAIIGEILVIGDLITSQNAIKKAMGIKSSDPFSYKKILDAQLRVRRLGAFSSVAIETIGLKEKEDVIHLRVKVDEERPFLLDMEIAYTTDEKYSGSLRFTNLNAFGWAKRNTLTFTTGQEVSRAELGWIDSSFLGSSFEFNANSWVQYKKEPTFNYIQLGGSSGFFRRFRRLGLLFKLEIDRNYFVEGSSAAADAQSLRNNTITKTSVSESYDTRDSFSDPRRGFFLLHNTDLFNEIKGNQANFIELSLSAEYNFSPFSWITFNSVVRGNRIYTFGFNVSVPTNELLFLGGDNTIRGFSEDTIGPVDANGQAVGGRVRWIFNEEARIRLGSSLQTAVFYDAGDLANDFGSLTTSSARHSFGFGLRYITPVGPIRADYAWKLDPKPGEDKNRFHFTFGYVF